MAVRRRTNKKIRKVLKRLVGTLTAGTDQVVTLHTVTDPGTTKRFIIEADVTQDTTAVAQYQMCGLCITSAGETLPILDNVEAEKERWIWVHRQAAIKYDNPKHITKDMKIQRKVKDGDIISFVTLAEHVDGDVTGVVTIFIDET